MVLWALLYEFFLCNVKCSISVATRGEVSSTWQWWWSVGHRRVIVWHDLYSLEVRWSNDDLRAASLCRTHYTLSEQFTESAWHWSWKRNSGSIPLLVWTIHGICFSDFSAKVKRLKLSHLSCLNSKDSFVWLYTYPSHSSVLEVDCHKN
jgi:hypothetical protein